MKLLLSLMLRLRALPLLQLLPPPRLPLEWSAARWKAMPQVSGGLRCYCCVRCWCCWVKAPRTAQGNACEIAHATWGRTRNVCKWRLNGCCTGGGIQWR